MTSEDALQQFGLPTLPEHLPEIRTHLEAKIAQSRADWGDSEVVRTLCAQLFSCGVVEDSLLIWKAKSCNWDSMCGLDVQLLCGAGQAVTKEWLRLSTLPEALKALAYLEECEQCGDFDSFTPVTYLAEVRTYYGLDSP